MNRLLLVFCVGWVGALIGLSIYPKQKATAFPSSSTPHFAASLSGDLWLLKHLSQESVNLDEFYQTRVFSNTLSKKTQVKRYQRSHQTWIEERTCADSPFIDRPLKARITSRYGRRLHPVSGRSHIHAGIDFRGHVGTPVLAASKGRVKAVRKKGAYGKTIIIDHGNSYTTLYGHLSGYAIKEGDWVHLGQTIGYIGRTGRATGPHLHFEVRCHNVPLNPMEYLDTHGKIAEVKFKRTLPSFRRSRRRGPAHVKRDPNYYTRMMNLRKLHNMRNKPVRRF